MRLLLPALAAVAVLAGCGSSDTTETVTVTQTETETRTVTVTSPGDVDADPLPEPVRKTRDGLLEAARSGDVEALAPYITDRFSYSFGGPVEGGAIAYFKRLEEQGEDPLGTLEKLLQLPWTLAQGNYVWPWVYSVRESELTAYEKQLLGEFADDFVDGTYYVWRTGIAPDGTWLFFVAGA